MGPYSNPGSLPGPIVNYKIYCSQHTFGTPPGTFSLLATVDENTFQYIDWGANIGTDNIVRSYYIKAVFIDSHESLSETVPTNTITVRLSLSHQKISNSTKDNVISNNLRQNHPNPFNPITTIDYSIKSMGLVSLKVYDILGTQVASLVNEMKEAGSYSVTFNASELPSGIYFYALTSGDFSSTKKLILLK